MQRIVAAIDTSPYADSVVDHAAWVAGRVGGVVELLHVIEPVDPVPGRGDMSGALGLGARSGLMEQLVALAEAQARLAREQGKALLAGAVERLAAAGVTAARPVHRHGSVVDTLIEREAENELVIIGKRGEQADLHANAAGGHIGSFVERMVRESIRPVLVAARAFAVPRTVVIAFDGGASASGAVDFLSGSRLLEGLAVHLVSVGTLDAARRGALDWARERLPEVTVHELAGPADTAIEALVRTLGAELLVMGAYGHSPLRSFILGSTTTALMRACPVSVLLFRRGF